MPQDLKANRRNRNASVAGINKLNSKKGNKLFTFILQTLQTLSKGELNIIIRHIP
jgi:hypothetical protein